MNLLIFLKFLHVTAAVVFLGDIIVTATWKWFADRTGDPSVAAYAQRLVLLTDKYLMLPSIGVLVTTGYIKAHMLQISAWTTPAILTGQILFFLSGIIWGVILRPIQMRQMEMANGFRVGDVIPADYMVLTKRWMLWGGLAIVLPIGSVFMMIYN